MNPEKHFEYWYDNSYVCKWVDHDKNIVRDAYFAGYGHGAVAKHNEVVQDREYLLRCLEQLDHEDDRKQEEELAKGQA